MSHWSILSAQGGLNSSSSAALVQWIGYTGESWYWKPHLFNPTHPSHILGISFISWNAQCLSGGRSHSISHGWMRTPYTPTKSYLSWGMNEHFSSCCYDVQYLFWARSKKHKLSTQLPAIRYYTHTVSHQRLKIENTNAVCVWGGWVWGGSKSTQTDSRQTRCTQKDVKRGGKEMKILLLRTSGLKPQKDAIQTIVNRLQPIHLWISGSLKRLQEKYYSRVVDGGTCVYWQLGSNGIFKNVCACSRGL